MLNTLLQIGQWQREGISEWDRFLNKPSVVSEDKKGNKIQNLIAEIVFDLDANDIYLASDSLKEYDEETDVERYKALKTQGRNSKSIYATVEPAKLIQLFKTFFGKAKDESVEAGEFTEAIDKNFPQYKDSELYKILQEVFILRPVFKDKYIEGEKAKVKEINGELGLEWNNNLVLIYASIKSASLGYSISTPISDLDDYISFLRDKLFPPLEEKADSQDKLCYASGEYSDSVAELNLATRYSLNKMFVSTTKNYASQFSEKSFSLNYQISSENQEKLDLASSFLLNNYKTRIAGIDHVILPQFLSTDNIEIDLVLDKLKAKSDLLFSLKTLDNLAEDMALEASEIFWINFVAFESNGNFFKTYAVIKDVSRFHFQNIIEAMGEVDWQMRELEGVVDWYSIKKVYGKPTNFNLYLVYRLIPVKEYKDKKKKGRILKNNALSLFKSILEQRAIDSHFIFQYFSELMLCHYYERYASYTNVQKYGKDYFGLAIRDSVFKYLAFILVLKKLKLVVMDETKVSSSNESGIQYEEAINEFFDRMDIKSDAHKAMFYLGRMLNRVEWLQLKKKIKRTVIHLVNFNGLDERDIERLYEDLFNKARQHNGVGTVKYISSQFHHYFRRSDWSLSPQESLFYLLSGYSFMVNKSEAEEQDEIENENEEV